MSNILYKLLIGKKEYNSKVTYHALEKQRKIFMDVWNNAHNDDTGIEKILRLFLILTHFFFPGIYIRDLFGRLGVGYKNLAIEFYVIFKLLFPLFLLLSGWYRNIYCILFIIYVLSETLFYVASLIFVSDLHMDKRSYRRTLLLLLMNYMEIVFDFAVIYGGFNLITRNVHSVIDYIYFSFITSVTIGYGDLYPTNNMAKMVVILHSMIFMVFVVLFLNFFSSKVATRDLFDRDR